MKDLLQKINDDNSSTQDRLNALQHFVCEGGLKDYSPITKEINNHIHTMYSFSPYTPSMAALRARQAGLAVAGSVDHDSLEAAVKMTEACKLLGLGCVTGFELRVSFKSTPFAGKKINNPDSTGIVYMTIQGVPVQAQEQVRKFLQKLIPYPIHPQDVLDLRDPASVLLVVRRKIFRKRRVKILTVARQIQSLYVMG